MRWIAVATDDHRDLDGLVSPHFGRCAHYALVEVKEGQVIGYWVVSNPHNGHHKPGQLPRYIHSIGASVILAGGMGPMAVEMFHDLGIEVATGASGTIREAVEAYLEGRLQGIVPCNHDHPESCGEHAGGGANDNTESPESAPRLTTNSTSTHVAVPAMNNDGLHSTMDSRFGRAPWFVVVELESGVVVNTLVNFSALNTHGAGTGAASLMASSGVDAVIAGRFGSKAHQALKALGIGSWTSEGGLTVEQAVVRLRSGELSKTA